jgi:hypothetical protein
MNWRLPTLFFRVCEQLIMTGNVKPRSQAAIDNALSWVCHQTPFILRYLNMSSQSGMLLGGCVQQGLTGRLLLFDHRKC